MRVCLTLTYFTLKKGVFLSETKIWSTIFILAIPAGEFLLPSFELIVAGLFIAFSASLVSGSLIGDHIAPLANLKGLGIFDLVTNKANKLDINRIIGHTVFLSVLAYVFQPLWAPEPEVRSDMVGLLGTIGVALFTASPFKDAKAVEKANSETTVESESAK